MILVTGCAGFIGSNLTRRLLEDGFRVAGIDNFSDYYSRDMKGRNMKEFADNKNFEFIEKNLLNMDLRKLIEGKDYVFHQSAQAGVRDSWGENFEAYTKNNILATQRLLEASKSSKIKKFVYASSSSVYGDAEGMPTKETDTPNPISPYGLSKLAGEHLCHLYWKNYGVPTVSLRYFTVYGPGQRPDMAFNKFIRGIIKGDEIELYGSGEQTRDFTYISDVVEANILAMKSDVSGEVFNIGGGSTISVNNAIKIIENIIGEKAKVRRTSIQKGDVKHTRADIRKAEKMLGYKPGIKIETGLEREIKWIKNT